MVQEKQGPDQGSKYPSTRYKRLVLLYQIFPVFLQPVYGLSMETTSIILAKPTIQCSETLVHHLHCLNVWNNILGSWLQKVSSTSSLRHNVLYYVKNGTLIPRVLNLTRNSWKCRTNQQDLFNAMGSMYAAVLFIGVQNASSVQPVVAIERTVFYRERAAGMYSALPYAFGQVFYSSKRSSSMSLRFQRVVIHFKYSPNLYMICRLWLSFHTFLSRPWYMEL
jgi:hypothetical protein